MHQFAQHHHHEASSIHSFHLLRNASSTFLHTRPPPSSIQAVAPANPSRCRHHEPEKMHTIDLQLHHQAVANRDARLHLAETCNHTPPSHAPAATAAPTRTRFGNPIGAPSTAKQQFEHASVSATVTNEAACNNLHAPAIRTITMTECSSNPWQRKLDQCTVTASHLCTSRNTCSHQRSAFTATIAAAPPRRSSHRQPRNHGREKSVRGNPNSDMREGEGGHVSSCQWTVNSQIWSKTCQTRGV